MTLPTNRDEAATLFLKDLLLEVYSATIEVTRSLLIQGPPGRRPLAQRVELKRWFDTLKQDDRDLVLRVAQYTARTALFRMLVLLDGATGKLALDGKIYEFGLYLEIHPNLESRTPETQIKINPSHTTQEQLHDMFVGILEENTQG